MASCTVVAVAHCVCVWSVSILIRCLHKRTTHISGPTVHVAVFMCTVMTKKREKKINKKILQRNRCQIIVDYIQPHFYFILAVLFLMLVVLCFCSFSLYLCFLDHLVVGAASLSSCCVDLCGPEPKTDDAYCLVLWMLFLAQFYGFLAFLFVLSASLSHPPRLG